MQFNWEGTSREHLAARLTRRAPGAASATELVPGLRFFQQETSGASPVFMGSAACMLVRREYFERLGGFDERLTLGYEDAEICWRAWLKGWKTVYVPKAICWHRVGSSGRSTEGRVMNFRGILRGRLLLATKLLPLRYAIRTWLISAIGIGKDLWKGEWVFAKNRLRTLSEIVQMLPEILRERKKLYQEARVTPAMHLAMLLGLSEQGPADQPRT
jgi:N-acetylglucosaminyl-diphospho-decaprenol L-rhamnosyltransferase